MRKLITEYCANCETEVEMFWDVETDGYKAYCPVCRARLMLCDECQHRNDGKLTDDCDYCSASDTCRFNHMKTVTHITQKQNDLKALIKLANCNNYDHLLLLLMDIGTIAGKNDEMFRVIEGLDAVCNKGKF